MLPASLRIPAFRRLVAAATLSVTGSLMTFVVLPVVAWEATGSAATFAFVLAAGSFGMLVAMPFGGVVADRFDRRLVMLVGNACQFSILCVMLLAVTQEAWWSLPLVDFVATFVGSLFASAGPALRRDALPDDVRTQGSAIFSAGMSTANLLGPLFGVGLYAATSFAVVIVVDLATVLVSFSLLLGLRMQTRLPATEDAVADARALIRRTFSDIASGIRVARVDPYLRRSLGAVMLGGLANGFLLVMSVPWLDHALGLEPEWWGIALSVMGASGLVGALVVARIGERIAPGRLITVGAATFAIGSLLLVGTPSTARMLLAFVMIGCTNAALSVGTSTVTQRRVASSHQGRISSLYVCSHQLTQVVSTLVAGAAGSVVGPIAGVSVAIVLFVATAGMYWRSAFAVSVPTPAFTEEELALSA